MKIEGTGKRVRIYVGEQDKVPGHREPLWETIFSMLRDEGAAGATMLRGLAGFGAHSTLHVARVADLVPDLPVIVEWIDGPERVERLLPRLSELVQSGTITVEEIDIVKYSHRAPRPLPPDRVGDVMTREVVFAAPGTPLRDVVRLLLDRDFRSVPVVDREGRLQGMITNRDLVERGGLGARVELLGALDTAARERELEPLRKTAADVMTRDVVSIRRDEPLERAAHLMAERRIKRLPVVDDDGRVIGILGRVDVLRTMGQDYHAPDAPPRPPGHAQVIGDLMRTDVPTVGADAPLGEVLDAVTSTRLNRAIVVDRDRRVLGVIGDADLLARLDTRERSGVAAVLMGRGRLAAESRARARDLMHTPALTVAADTPVSIAAERMLAARHKVLPIVDPDGRLLGALDRADLLRHLAAS